MKRKDSYTGAMLEITWEEIKKCISIDISALSGGGVG